MNSDLIGYYRDRAPEYDKLYANPIRQADLQKASAYLENLFSGKHALEVACGSGYWTEAIGRTVRSLLATDINETMLDIARSRVSGCPAIEFQKGDMYKLQLDQPAECLFGGFIWSHILLDDLTGFLDTMEGYLQPGGTLVFMDNLFVPGSNTPISFTDTGGNTYQDRQLEGSGTHRILKNFPAEDYLQSLVSPRASAYYYLKLDYYWILSYKKRG